MPYENVAVVIVVLGGLRGSRSSACFLLGRCTHYGDDLDKSWI